MSTTPMAVLRDSDFVNGEEAVRKGMWYTDEILPY